MGFKHVLSVIPGWYMENFKHPMHFGNGYYPFGGFPSVPDADGVVRMRYPSVSGEKESGIPIVSIKDDFGDIVHGLLLNPEKYDGKTVLAIGEVLEYDELTTQFTKGAILLTRIFRG